MRTLLIVYHTLTGGTLQMAEAAARGARRAGADAGPADAALRIELRHARDTDATHLLAADGYVFATPENLAMMSGQLKDFFDRSYYAALERINGRPYALLVCAGSDGTNAVRQVERIATGWRLKAVAPPVIVCTQAQTPERILAPKQLSAAQLAPCEELGATLAAGLALGIF